ncbi:hypothetical protein NUW54_g10893 [Trametes sanguinea]|uniref:Uncharacterized protein n=1 Tax=Trametes sanguinea TaxID=158606 RepID=A0ACC1NS94_9APHY|nr:hypothetical protein NUW54_g10893 [Trametes sanguinea]
MLEVASTRDAYTTVANDRDETELYSTIDTTAHTRQEPEAVLGHSPTTAPVDHRAKLHHQLRELLARPRPAHVLPEPSDDESDDDDDARTETSRASPAPAPTRAMPKRSAAEKSKKAVSKAFQPIVISSDDEDEDEEEGEEDDDGEEDVEATPVAKPKASGGKRSVRQCVLQASLRLTSVFLLAARPRPRSPPERRRRRNWTRTSTTSSRTATATATPRASTRQDAGSDGVPPGEWPEICGCTISVRQNEDIISLWNRHDGNAKSKEKIKETIRRVLNLPPTTVMEYKSNNDSMQERDLLAHLDRLKFFPRDRPFALERVLAALAPLLASLRVPRCRCRCRRGTRTARTRR